MKAHFCGELPIRGTSLTLSGLSTQGSILLPIEKDEEQKQRIRQDSANRTNLIAAARKGDEDAIEMLTMEDMDMYSTISKKIQKEDVFSIVDTYFMPYGVECDHYSVLGEIMEYSKVRNYITGEEIFLLKIWLLFILILLIMAIIEYFLSKKFNFDAKIKLNIPNGIYNFYTILFWLGISQR